MMKCLRRIRLDAELHSLKYEVFSFVCAISIYAAILLDKALLVVLLGWVFIAYAAFMMAVTSVTWKWWWQAKGGRDIYFAILTMEYLERYKKLKDKSLEGNQPKP